MLSDLYVSPPSLDVQTGDPGKAYEYIHHNGGLVSYQDYPYDSRGGEAHVCDHRATAHKKVVQVNGYSRVYKEADMIEYVLSTGPLSVCLNAGTLSSYTGGILTHCGTTINHCAQIVGVNVPEQYWIIRNTWGTIWGEHGYYYIALVRLTDSLSPFAYTVFTDPVCLSVFLHATYLL